MDLNPRLGQRLVDGERLLNELRRARKAITVTEFAARIGVTAQNFETAKYLRGLCLDLRKHLLSCDTPEEVQDAVQVVARKVSQNEEKRLRDMVAKLGTRLRYLEVQHEAQVRRLKTELARTRETKSEPPSAADPACLPHVLSTGE